MPKDYRRCPEKFEEKISKMEERFMAADKLLIDVSKGKVLEIGCGTGRFLEKINDKCDAIGIDIFEEMVQYCNKMKRGKAILADGNSLPFEDNCFDAVVGAYFSFKEIDINKAYPEIFRILKIGGMVAYTLINPLTRELAAIYNEFKNNNNFNSIKQRVLSAIKIYQTEPYRILPAALVKNEKAVLLNAGFRNIRANAVPCLPFLRRSGFINKNTPVIPFWLCGLWSWDIIIRAQKTF